MTGHINASDDLMETEKLTVRRGPKPNPATRDNLLQAGVKMFHEVGYSASGVKDIVDRASVPKGSFYNYFESKEAFGEAVVDYYFDSGAEELGKLLGNDDVPSIQRLKSYFESRISFFQQSGYVRGCMLGNFSLEVADHSPRIQERIVANFNRWNALIENCLAEGQLNGEISSKKTVSCWPDLSLIAGKVPW